MKKALLVLSFLFIFAAGCSQDEAQQSIAELTKENEKLTEQLQSMKTQEVEEEREQDKEQTSGDDGAQARSEHLDDERDYYQQIVGELLEKHVNAESFGVFDPTKLKAGDKVSNLTVDKLYMGGSNNKTDVQFSGSFTAKGDVFVSESTGDYLFRVLPEDAAKIPKTAKDLELGPLTFAVDNTDDLKAALGEKNESIEGSEKVTVEASFKNFRYYFIPESDALDSAEFIPPNG